MRPAKRPLPCKKSREMHLYHLKFSVAKNSFPNTSHFHFLSYATKNCTKLPPLPRTQVNLKFSVTKERSFLPSFVSVLLVAQFVGDCGREEGRKEEKAERGQATDRPPIGRESERGARPTDTADGRKEREKAAVWQERAAQCYGLMYACQKQEGRREGRKRMRKE